MNVKLPDEIQQAFNAVATRCALAGESEAWDRLQTAANRLGPLDHVEDLGAVLGLVERRDMPQLVAAVRLGIILCRAIRTEIDAVRTAAGSN